MKILSHEKDFFFVQAKMRSEVFCWKVGRRRERWMPPQPTTVTMWPESMRNSSKVLCITTTAILLRYAFYYRQPTPHPLLVGLAETVNLSPTPHSSQNFFSVCFQLCESHPSIKPSNHIAESIMCMPTNSLQNRLVPSKS